MSNTKLSANDHLYYELILASKGRRPLSDGLVYADPIRHLTELGVMRRTDTHFELVPNAKLPEPPEQQKAMMSLRMSQSMFDAIKAEAAREGTLPSIWAKNVLGKALARVGAGQADRQPQRPQTQRPAAVSGAHAKLGVAVRRSKKTGSE